MTTNETRPRYEFILCPHAGSNEGQVVATAEYKTYKRVLIGLRNRHPGKTIRVHDREMKSTTTV